MTQKTKGNGDYETYAYDTCNEVIGIGYYWLGGIGQNGLTYSYDLAGNVLVYNQGFYNTTYGYDGADQLTTEAQVGERSPGNTTWGILTTTTPTVCCRVRF